MGNEEFFSGWCGCPRGGHEQRELKQGEGSLHVRPWGWVRRGGQGGKGRREDKEKGREEGDTSLLTGVRVLIVTGLCIEQVGSCDPHMIFRLKMCFSDVHSNFQKRENFI